MPRDPAILAHQEWLGYVQPTGLVVSIPSLIDASAFLNRNYGPEHQRLLSALPQDSDGSPIPEVSDFARFAQDVFGWDSDLMLGSPGAQSLPPELEVNLESYNETLRPTYALRSLDGDGKWLLLVEVLPTGTDLDQTFAPHDRGWQASPQARFERLLRQTGVPIGLLVNGRQIRLVYAPDKELSGHITFKLGDMVKVAGRPIFAALQMLLSAERLYSVADKERLPAILANSRKYQNVVSTQLAAQVLEALYELLRGFQAANDQSKGDLLRDVLARDPDHVYHGLLTTLLRLVFVLFAEDRGLLSTDPIYSNYYSITGLYERLRADAGRYPDTMDQRYGAWAQLLALFGLMYSGGSHGAMKIPAREGYLTGFLVPLDAAPEDKSDETANDELDDAGEPGGGDDDDVPEKPAARARYFPSSIGISVLVPASAKTLKVRASWGDYRLRTAPPEQWERTARQETVAIELSKASEKPVEKEIPNSNGLKIAYLARAVGMLAADAGVPADARTVSVFLVNRRTPQPDVKKDEAFAFQVQLEISGDTDFLPRPDLRSLASGEWDERVSDLQYRDIGEYSVGHNVATDAVLDGKRCCNVVQTCWIPQAEVERVEPAQIKDVELRMDALATLTDAAEANAKLNPLVTAYREWIKAQGAGAPTSPAKRKATGEELLNRARVAANRIQAGIDLLADPQCLDAFRIANKCMADAARQRQGLMLQKPVAEVNPTWRPFQLAFILMNLKAIATPSDDDRDTVDLLFFPTGGGKTEAYLGLAAFTLVLRRLRNPGIQSAGLSVLMRYTLRLLTLDQLGRAATLVCALELLRRNDVDKFGEWPFEIGLWVGRAATPNRMGSKGDNDPNSARARTRKFWDSDKNPSPIPLEECPWCGTKFTRNSFRLTPNPDNPTNLLVKCVRPQCSFAGNSWLPIVAVDEPIYRRLPCFMIATVDKFAALPWTGEVGGFFGRVERHDKGGFYGPCDPLPGSKLPNGRLLPPDLIIQDELHLISGPLGTMVGLYETALDELCAIEKDGKTIRPKIIASTATVRRADSQIRALFNRQTVDIFPPPGPDRRDSFFAVTLPSSSVNARLYVGVAAQGRSPKVAMLRVYLALLGSGQRWHNSLKKKGEKSNAVDPYMSLVGYFNSLRELGGARRLIEDEVRNRLAGYATRKRVGETEGLFDDRKIGYEPVELTSRVSTAEVSTAKRRLSLFFSDESRVDVAIATNMISVGLDIIRLGLMVVFGQPKASAEYIQATSRVGRDAERPGLIVTIFNVHKPRDRSQFERFSYYHQTFYRSVEATSVTPFSPRALDKGLAATLVGLSRQGYKAMNPPLGAMEILNQRASLESVVKTLADRAFAHAKDLPSDDKERLRLRVQERARDLLDDWAKVAQDYQSVGTGLQYNPTEAGGAKQLLYDFLSPEVKNLPPDRWQMKFRANRSLRDVEAEVNLWVRTLADEELEEEKI